MKEKNEIKIQKTIQEKNFNTSREMRRILEIFGILVDICSQKFEGQNITIKVSA